MGGLSNIVFNAGLYQKLPYDPLTDLVPVALVFNISYTLVAHKVSSLFDPEARMLAAAKKDPADCAKLANAGTGTGQHILGAAFMKFTGTKFLEVPYRGSSAAFPDCSPAVSTCLSISTAREPCPTSSPARPKGSRSCPRSEPHQPDCRP